MNIKVVIIVIAILSAVFGVWFLGIGTEDVRPQFDSSKMNESVTNLAPDPNTNSEVVKPISIKPSDSAVILEADSDGQFPKSTPQELEAAIRAVNEIVENAPTKEYSSRINRPSAPIDAIAFEDADFEVERSSKAQLQEAIQELEDKRASLNAKAK